MLTDSGDHAVTTELRMWHLILTTSDSGAGCLKASRIADEVIGLSHRLVCGPIPDVPDPISFFSEREHLARTELSHVEGEVRSSIKASDWCSLLEKCRRSSRIEIWVDPVPNAQLQLIQLLDWFEAYPDIIAKLALVHIDFPISEREPEEIRSIDPVLHNVERKHVEAASRAWHALQQPTPEAWYDLLTREFDFPYLHQTVLRLLQELPAAHTALTASEARLLVTISRGEAHPLRVLADQIAAMPRPLLDYWELGQSLDELAHCPRPVILGLAGGPFTLEMHDDRSRFELYKNSSIALSELGQSLVEGQEDFSRYNTIDRWWGGTKLINNRLWRWDAANNTLLSPSSNR
jgi:hypothetical protein